MDRLEVARFTSLPEAEMAAALLQRHGLDARVPDRDTATVVAHMQLALGGLRVTVQAHQIVEARALMAQVRAGDIAGGVDDLDAVWQADEGLGPVNDLPEEGEAKGALRGMRPIVRLVGDAILLLVLIAWINQLLRWI